MSDAKLLVAASGLSGAAAAFFVWLAEWELGTARFEVIAVLWTIWAISGAVLTFSAQLASIVDGGNLWRSRSFLFTVSIAVVGVVGATAALRERLFDEHRWFFVVIAGVIPLGAAFIGDARGRWARVGAFRETARLIASENAIRALFAVVAVGSGIASPPVLALAIATGFIAGIQRPPTDRNADGSPTRRQNFGVIAAATLLAHSAASGAPLVIGAAGGTDESISQVFLLIFLLRMPAAITQGLLPRVSAHFSQRIGQNEPIAMTRELRQILSAAILIAVVAAATAAPLLGPITATIFGNDARSDAATGAIATAATLLALGNQFATTGFVAAHKHWLIARAWLGAAAICALGFLMLDGSLTSPRDILTAVLAIELLVVGTLFVAAANPQKGQGALV